MRVEDRHVAGLRAIQPRREDLRLGSVRLPAAAAQALRRRAESEGLSFSEGLRRALTQALRAPARLASAAPTNGATVRIGGLPMPAALAERLTAAAAELGVSMNELVLRSVLRDVQSSPLPRKCR
jgi:hypothetical protein